MIKPNEYASRFMLHDLRFTICFTICLFISPDLDGMFTNKQNASSHDMLADSKPSVAPKILELFVGPSSLSGVSLVYVLAESESLLLCRGKTTPNLPIHAINV